MVTAGDDGDLAARVARLEQAMAGAGAALSGGGPSSSGESTSSVRREVTTPIEKGIRTVVQVALAGLPGLGVIANDGSPLVAAVVTLAMTPVVTVVQNALEDADKLPKLLRRWTDDDPPPATATGADLAP